MNLRKLFFWTHLVSGLTAGLVIALLALTGLTLSFEPQITALLERDVRRIPAAPAGAEKTSVEALMKAIREENPEARPAGFTVYADSQAAILIPAGRDLAYYANPFTAEIKEVGATKVRRFFSFTLLLHRYLALSGEQRRISSQVIGVATSLFLGLSVTGLIIWWPRKWAWRAMKPSVWFIGAQGKLRDWNWHNVIGLWSTPVLILICVTGLMMTYRWVGNLGYVLTGNPVPAAPARGAGEGEPAPASAGQAPAVKSEATAAAPMAMGAGGDATEPVVVPAPPPGTRPLAYDPLLAKVYVTYPNWTQLTLRTGGNQRQRRPEGPRAGATPDAAGNATPAAETRPAAARADAAGERRESGSGGAGGRDRPARAPQAVTVTLRTDDMWFSTSAITLSLNPYTGDILRTQSFADQNIGRRIRALAKPLHTGLIAGWPTQLLAALGTIGAVFLVYTGFALSWRRFFGKRKARPAA